jgi:hypothetical protein
MGRQIIWELKKICFRRSFLIVSVLFLLLAAFLAKTNVLVQPYTGEERKLLTQYTGRPASDLDAIIAVQNALKSANPALYETADGKDNANDFPTTLGFGQQNFIEYLQWIQDVAKDNQTQLASLQEKLSSSSPNTYDARLLQLQINTLQSLPEAKITTMADMNESPLVGLDNSGGGFIMLLMGITALFIIFAVGPVYSREYQSNVNDLLLTAKDGTGRALAAKSVAAVCIGVVAALVVQAIQLAFYLHSFPLDWSVSAVSMETNDFINIPMTVGQMYGVLLLLNILGCAALALLTMLLSSFSHLPTLPIGVGLVLWVLPVFYTLIPGGQKLWFVTWLKCLSIMGAQIPSQLGLWFEKYMNIFGFPVQELAVSAAFAAILGVLCILFAPRLFSLRNAGFRRRDGASSLKKRKAQAETV